jgi:hypothetical protein
MRVMKLGFEIKVTPDKTVVDIRSFRIVRTDRRISLVFGSGKNARSPERNGLDIVQSLMRLTVSATKNIASSLK